MPLVIPLMPVPQLIQTEHGSKITTYGNDYSTSPILFPLLNLPILPRSLQTALDPAQYWENNITRFLTGQMPRPTNSVRGYYCKEAREPRT